MRYQILVTKTAKDATEQVFPKNIKISFFSCFLLIAMDKIWISFLISIIRLPFINILFLEIKKFCFTFVPLFWFSPWNTSQAPLRKQQRWRIYYLNIPLFRKGDRNVYLINRNLNNSYELKITLQKFSAYIIKNFLNSF